MSSATVSVASSSQVTAFALAEVQCTSPMTVSSTLSPSAASFKFRRYCVQGAQKWIEAYPAGGGGVVLLWVGKAGKSPVEPNLKRKPYKIRKVTDRKRKPKKARTEKKAPSPATADKRKTRTPKPAAASAKPTRT